MITLPSGRTIGPDAAPFIIAEVGSNWRNLDDCRHSIAMAKAAGADAVKLQLFDHKALYGLTPEQVNGDGPFNFYSTVGAYALPPEWLPHLKEKADKVGIEFMCSAFSPELVAIVDPFVNLHKVASAEMSHVRMLEKLKQIGKPVILSTGASGKEDISMATKTLGDTPTILLYCVAAYPAREINLSTLAELRMVFGRPVGFSDHSTDVGVIPARAVELGAVVLEKHFTDIPEVDTPDRPHSLTVDEFKRMVEIIRNGPEKRIGYTREENPMVLRHNRRLLATKDITPGVTLVEGENFGIYRSLQDDAKGLTPFAVNHVNGKRAAVHLKAGEGIGPKDFG